MHAEDPGGAALVPVLALERTQHIGLLEALARLLQRQRRRLAHAPTLPGLVHGEIERQVLEEDDGPRGQRHAALDDVLQLAHVPRPVIRLERRERALGHAPDVLLELPRIFFHEVVDKEGDVLLAVAERGHAQGNDVEAIEEVFAERPRPHRLLEVDIGRGDDPDVHGDGADAAEALDLALLQCAEKLRLEVDAQAPHLVEEQCAAVGQLELPGLPRVSAREGALLVTEQLRFEQRVGYRREVHGDERLVAPEALPMDRARHQLLAGAALRGDEHGDGRGRHLRDQLVQPRHARMPAHQRVEAMRPVEFRAQVAHLALEQPVLGGLAHEEEDLVGLEGLDDVVVGPRLHGVHRRSHLRHRGHQDDRNGLAQGENARQHRGAGLARHPDVEQRHVDPARSHDLEGRRAVRGLEHLEVVLEDDAQGLADSRLIVDDQDDRPRRIRERRRRTGLTRPAVSASARVR